MRQRHFRAIRITSTCGCCADLNTGRYRVSKALCAILVGSRNFHYCRKHPGMHVPGGVKGQI